MCATMAPRPRAGVVATMILVSCRCQAILRRQDLTESPASASLTNVQYVQKLPTSSNERRSLLLLEGPGPGQGGQGTEAPRGHRAPHVPRALRTFQAAARQDAL